jgi:hypothetical protein
MLLLLSVHCPPLFYCQTPWAVQFHLDTIQTLQLKDYPIFQAVSVSIANTTSLWASFDSKMHCCPTSLIRINSCMMLSKSSVQNVNVWQSYNEPVLVLQISVPS